MPEPVQIPTLEESVLIEDDRIQAGEIEKLRKDVETFTQQEERLTEEISKQDLDRNLERLNDMVQKRPETVAAVIRSWMAHETSREEES